MKPDSPDIKIRKATDKTLAEQLLINDRELAYRKALLGFTEEDEKILKSLKSTITDGVDYIVENFYDAQLQNNEISLLIGDVDTLRRLSQAMRRYILELFEGFYDGEYVNKRLRIGKVHKRIGVSPKLYVSAVNQLQIAIDDYILKEDNANKDCHSCGDKRKAVHKLLMFDMQLVFDTYISSLVAEVQVAKGELEDYATSLETTIAERTSQLKELSTLDGLTGLLNQRGFYENLRRELSVAERNARPLTIIYFDLNGFKKINDTKGHKEGDRVLECVGTAIRATIRDIDFGCRYGGDEFCVIMPNATKENTADACDRLISAYETHDTLGVTFSIGIAQVGPEKFCSSDALVKKADTLMYKAKAKAKKRPGHYKEH
ncbi:MAG: GGDEF domain-containing protein [Alphaproteobacteria bacterium]|nr:GGDEF domain-containing protein [Rhodospirillales bacterium]MCW9045466.1 GGDEF domain-containing protein [Alphaproteobacteria bacterium]